MKMSMLCQHYNIDRGVGKVTRISVDFILPISPNNVKDIAEALKKIELMLASGIDLVKAVPDQSRCFHCGVLNGSDNTTCAQCGAPL